MTPLPSLSGVLRLGTVARGHVVDQGGARLAVLALTKLSPPWLPRIARAAVRPAGRRARPWLLWAGGDPEAAHRSALELWSRPGGAVAAARFVVATDDAALARVVCSRAAVPAGLPNAWRRRVLWTAGEPLAAVAGALPDRTRAGRRRAAALAVLDGSWTDRPGGVLTRAAHPRPDAPLPPGAPHSLHLLTSSLPHTQSGYTLRSHALLTALQRSGAPVSAATRLGYPVAVGAVRPASADVVDQVTYWRLAAPGRLLDASAYLRSQTDRLVALADSVGPDVLHTTTAWTNGLTAAAAADRTGLPWVYEVRGLLEETWAARAGPDGSFATRSRLQRERETEAMLRADAVVTIAGTMKAAVVARGVPEAKVTVLPNAVPLSSVRPRDDERRAQVRTGLGIGRDDVVVGTVTSVVAYEGLTTLVEAVAAAGPRGRLRVLVVGDGASMPELRRAGQVLGDRLLLPGRVPHAEVAGLLDAMDVFVVPRVDSEVTRHVTPLKPVEAMAAGLPVVASDLPALQEVLEDGRAGELVPPGDVAALREVLVRLAGDEDRRRVLGEAGQDAVRRTRTWEDVAATLQQVYRDLGRRA